MLTKCLSDDNHSDDNHKINIKIERISSFSKKLFYKTFFTLSSLLSSLFKLFIQNIGVFQSVFISDLANYWSDDTFSTSSLSADIIVTV